METFVVRVWVPDRPGALGQVASRIGAVGGDVVGIDILERGAGKAIDELFVTLPSADLTSLLVAEISQVEDAAVEEVRSVSGELPEPGVAALESSVRIVEAGVDDRLRCLCEELRALLVADWVRAVSMASPRALVELGSTDQSPAWIAAFVDGSSHLPAEEQSRATPADLAWTALSRHGVAIAVGRSGSPVRARERRQVMLLGRLADGLGMTI